MTLLLLLAVALPALTALVAGATRRPSHRAIHRGAVVGGSWLSAAAAVALLVGTLADGPRGLVGDTTDWWSLGLHADAVGAIATALAAVVGLIVQVFAVRSMPDSPGAARFGPLTATIVAAAGLVALGATATTVTIGWIATSLAVAGLIGHRGDPAARRAARRARRTFVVGDVALVAAAIVLVGSTGDGDLRDPGAIVEAGSRTSILGVDVAVTTVVALLLVVAGATRSLLLPFHRWLPGTLAAPTPVSAVLHAGVVNGLAVLLVRNAPIVGESAVASALLFAAAATTTIWAVAVMSARTDVKGALAWSTVAQMGFMSLQVAVGAFAGAMFHLVGHALYKATAFLGAGGAVRAKAGSRGTPVGTPTWTSGRRWAVSIAVPAAAMAVSLAVVDPHLPATGVVLVALFGTASTATALSGWLRGSPWSVPASVSTGTVAVLAASFGYVGGMAVFETAVAPVVPFEPAGSVGPAWLLATLGVVAASALVMRWAPGAAAANLRRRLYVALLWAGDDTATPAPAVTAAATSPAGAPRPVVGDDLSHAPA